MGSQPAGFGEHLVLRTRRIAVLEEGPLQRAPVTQKAFAHAAGCVVYAAGCVGEQVPDESQSRTNYRVLCFDAPSKYIPSISQAIKVYPLFVTLAETCHARSERLPENMGLLTLLKRL